MASGYRPSGKRDLGNGTPPPGGSTAVPPVKVPNQPQDLCDVSVEVVCHSCGAPVPVEKVYRAKVEPVILCKVYRCQKCWESDSASVRTELDELKTLMRSIARLTGTVLEKVRL